MPKKIHKFTVEPLYLFQKFSSNLAILGSNVHDNVSAYVLVYKYYIKVKLRISIYNNDIVH